MLAAWPTSLALFAGQLAQPFEHGGQFAPLAPKIARTPVLQRLGGIETLKLPRARSRSAQPPLFLGRADSSIAIVPVPSNPLSALMSR